MRGLAQNAQRIQDAEPGSSLIWRLSLAAAMTTGLLWWSLLSIPNAAAAPATLADYDCVTYGHCYAIVTWPGTVTGTETTMTVVALYCDQYHCNTQMNYHYHLSDEMWLVDTTHQAPNCLFGVCWIEVGQAAFPMTPNSNSDVYFWAENRPGMVYLEHPGNVTYYDFGYTTNLSITPSGSGAWSISASSHTYGNGLVGSTTSANNSMQPDTIRIGMELYDYCGYCSDPAYAPSSDFTYNQWSNNSPFFYQGADYPNKGQDYLQYPPPKGYWNVIPAPGTNGGDLVTYCGCD